VVIEALSPSRMSLAEVIIAAYRNAVADQTDKGRHDGDYFPELISSPVVVFCGFLPSGGSIRKLRNVKCPVLS
jgi:hypothetical protein